MCCEKERRDCAYLDHWLVSILFLWGESDCKFVNKSGYNSLHRLLWSADFPCHYHKLCHVFVAAPEQNVVTVSLEGEIVNVLVHGDESGVSVVATS